MQIGRYEIGSGLLVKSPWIDLILSGKKTMEVRGQSTAKRGRIALIKSGTGLVFGTIEIVGVKGPFVKEDMSELEAQHRIPSDWINTLTYSKIYGWLLQNPESLPEPVAYVHKRGAQSWVTL